MPSIIPTPYAVLCNGDNRFSGCGKVYLTQSEYNLQMNHPNYTWRCPKCKQEAYWDDDNYEKSLGIEDE